MLTSAFTFKKRFIPLLISIAVLSLFAAVFLTGRANALTGGSWQAGIIASDSVFYNNGSMSAAEIQSFLNQKNPSCDTWGTQPASEYGRSDITRAQYAQQVGWSAPPYICLKDYHQVPRSDTIINNFNSNASVPSGAISAAQIIKNAADSYGVNPKVLLVLLQKESAGPLPVDKWPLQNQYKSAMGYACPDTAPCDPQYAGFYNQMMNAARQIKIYKDNPNSYRHKPFTTVNIYYNPNLNGCGNSPVYLQSMATAGLYNYTPYQPNAAALNNLYGSGDSCSAYGNRNFWRIFSDWFGSTQHETNYIGLKTQLSGVGWTGSTVNFGVSGTVGNSRPVEAFRVDGFAEYSSYNNTTGWQPTVSDGMVSGTEGQSKSIQAIKLSLTSSISNDYDIYYRTHIGNVGWLGWTKNGAISGVIGGPNAIEAIEIYLTPKNGAAPGSTSDSYRTISTSTQTPPVSISVQSHVSNVGWSPIVTDGVITGVSGKNKNIEAIKLQNTSNLTGSISYSSHVSGKGWQNYVKDGALSGTEGASRSVESVRIALSGEFGRQYDIWYRGFVEGMGWLDWTNNNKPAGSMGASKKLQALETRLVLKNTKGPGRGTGGIYNPTSLALPASYSLTYSAHVSNIGWTSSVKEGGTAGTVGATLPLEAFRFDTTSSVFGQIGFKCEYVSKGLGWTTATDATCGTTGQTRALRAVKLSLPDELKSNYTLLFRVHLAWKGWQGWQGSGTVAGFPDDGSTKNPVEAIEIKLIEK